MVHLIPTSLLSHSKVTSPSSFPFHRGLGKQHFVTCSLTFQMGPLPWLEDAMMPLVSVQKDRAHSPTEAGLAERLSPI